MKPPDQAASLFYHFFRPKSFSPNAVSCATVFCFSLFSGSPGNA